MSVSKIYIDIKDFQRDSYLLAEKVIESGFAPNAMIALWRGGCFPGMHVHETLKYFGINTNHIAIRTSKYTGIDQSDVDVKVYNLGYISEIFKPDTKVLIVDDIFDTGLTIEAVFDALKKRLGDNMPTDIRVATVHYKPKRNKTDRKPDYYIHETNEWIVYPHEVEAMNLEEIKLSKGKEISDIFKRIINLRLAENNKVFRVVVDEKSTQKYLAITEYFAKDVIKGEETDAYIIFCTPEQSESLKEKFPWIKKVKLYKNYFTMTR